MMNISRRFDEGKSTKKSFKNLRYGPQKTVSKHLNSTYVFQKQTPDCNIRNMNRGTENGAA